MQRRHPAAGSFIGLLTVHGLKQECAQHGAEVWGTAWVREGGVTVHEASAFCVPQVEEPIADYHTPITRCALTTAACSTAQPVAYRASYTECDLSMSIASAHVFRFTSTAAHVSIYAGAVFGMRQCSSSEQPR